jgi:antirestriction protein ArdC
MSNNFKPLSEQVAGKLIAQIEAGTSVFQQGDKPLQMPFNPTSGKNYRGAAALTLLIANREDPRWMSLENANYNRTPINKGEKGTLISFYKTSEMKPLMKDGEQVMTDKGKPKMEKVKLDEPVLTTAFLWNGEQLDKIAPYEAKQQELSASQRTAVIIGNSQIPVPSLKELAEQLVAQKPSDSTVKDALIANIAELFVKAELNEPFDLGDHIGYTAIWSQLMKEQPAELFKAANDAQKIADKILGFEKKKEQQLSTTLNKGDQINYKGETFKVLAMLRGKTAQVQKGETEKFKISPKDKLYSSLIEAKNSPEQQQSRGQAMPAPAEKETTKVEQGYAMSM